MSYDYGRKYISKYTGLTGIESKNIAKQIEEAGLDYQSFDWKTIGENLYGHGHRTKGVKHHLKEMYGISLDIDTGVNEYRSRKKDLLLSDLMGIFERRSHRSKIMDLHINARNRYKPSDKEGVKRWRKDPNLFDIIGIDDIID